MVMPVGESGQVKGRLRIKPDFASGGRQRCCRGFDLADTDRAHQRAASDHCPSSTSANATPILNPFRQTTRHGSFSLSSGTINVNAAGTVVLRSESSSAAPVTERSRMMQGVLSP